MCHCGLAGSRLANNRRGGSTLDSKRHGIHGGEVCGLANSSTKLEDLGQVLDLQNLLRQSRLDDDGLNRSQQLLRLDTLLLGNLDTT
ncbi:hypothetical protein D3C73_1392620 [compost metagenome]